MTDSNKIKKENKIISFFKGIFEKLDKKMEAKAKSGSCCDKDNNNSCCS